MSQNPYAAPEPALPQAADISQQYNQLPWYRKSSYVSLMTVLGLCCGPAILAVCIIVLTGEVYYNQADASGNLKKWGYANKVAAIIILVIQVVLISARVIGIAAMQQP